MLVIRFFRVGKKNQPSFKIVITDKRNPPSGGRFVEEVGFWNPLTKEKVLKEERIKYWLSVGAKASASVHNLLVSEKVIEGEKMPVHKKAKAKEEKEAEADKEPEAEVKKEEKPKEPDQEKQEEAVKLGKETPAAKEEVKEPSPEKKEALPEEKSKELKKKVDQPKGEQAKKAQETEQEEEK